MISTFRYIFLRKTLNVPASFGDLSQLFLKKLVLGLFTFMGVSSYAQQTYTLQQAQSYASEHAYQGKLAEIEVKLTEQTVNTVKAMVFPQIGGSVSFTHYIDIPTSVAPPDAFGFPSWLTNWITDVSTQTGQFPNVPTNTGDSEFQELQFGSKYNTSVGLSANQLIFDGSYFVGLKAIKAANELSGLQKTQTEISTREKVTDAYYTALVAQENMKTLSKSKNVLTQTVKETGALYESGFAEDITVDQLQINLTKLENSLKNAQMQYDLALNMLKYQMGMPLEEGIVLSDSLDSFTSGMEKDAADKQINISSHPDFQLMEANFTLMTLNKKSAQYEIYPKLRGFFNYQQNAFSNKFDLNGGSGFFPTTLWGVNLEVPIFGGGLYNANLAKAKLDVEKAEIQKLQVEEGLKLGQKSAKTAYLNALDSYQSQKENLALADKIERKTTIKFKEGVASSLELTQAQNQYLQTQGSYIGALFQLVKSRLQLEKSLGTL